MVVLEVVVVMMMEVVEIVEMMVVEVDLEVEDQLQVLLVGEDFWSGWKVRLRHAASE